MADSKTIHCSACDNKMTFGGASSGLVKAYGGMKAVMEMMATRAGWRKVADKWVCNQHG